MPNTGSRRNTIHTLIGMGSTALVAAVPYPGKGDTNFPEGTKGV